MKKKPTRAEAKEVWDGLEKPSLRKVANKFAAAGRPVHHKTIWKWMQDGWVVKEPVDLAQAAAAALAKIDNAVPALTGDVKSTTADIVESNKGQSPDRRSYAERAEAALLEALTGATAVWARIRRIAAAQPEKDGAAGQDAPPMLLHSAPEGLAKLMMAASAAINLAIEGGGQLAASRAEEAAAVPGTQTVYPPGHGPHADSSHANGFHERDYLSRSTIESLDQVLEEFRKQNA